MANILPEVQHGKLFQRDYTTGVSIHGHGIIINLIRKLKNRLQDDFFGYKVTELFENCPIEQVDG